MGTSVDGRQLSVISHQSSVISCQSSVIGYRCQLSVVAGKLPEN